ncbi:unnamed protein product [Brassica oleracea var. botrytis]
MKLTVVSAVILVVVFVAWPVSAGGSGHEEEEDDTKSWFPLDNLLSLNYYDKSCPNFEKIVDTKVRQWTKSDPSLGPALLRLLFHDCGVTGCDASVLLDHEGSERKSPASKTLRGFELIDDIKSEMEKSCPKLVSCADILAAATRSATYQLGGPYWPNAYGRQAAVTSLAFSRHFSLTDSTSSTLSSFPGPTPSEKHTVEPSNRGFTTSTQHMELIRPLILNSQIT